MSVLTQTIDPDGRVSLPASFANAQVTIEQINETELRIRKTAANGDADHLFSEEIRPPLSERDRDLFLALLENPPAANDALKNLLRKKA